MKRIVLGLSLLVTLVTLIASPVATALTIDDCVLNYKFEETSGTVFTDSGPDSLDGALYRPVKYGELPAMDVANVAAGAFAGPFMDGAIEVGRRYIGSTDQDVLVRVPTSTSLPGTGDSFAVSFWTSVSDWTGTGGLLAASNTNDLQWSIGFGGAYGMAFWTDDADPESSARYFHADCAALTPNTFNHFVVQYEGTSGISAVYVNGTSVSDSPLASGWWANEREGLTLGGRDVDARNYSVPSNDDPYLEDFAIISGVVDANDVTSLMTSGAASLGTRRIAHYTLNETSGTQIGDSSGNGNHGTLVTYDPTTMGAAVRDVATASRSGGVFDNCVEIADNDDRDDGTERVMIPSADAMPTGGEAFTVCFWMKPDENITAQYGGWDTAGMICSWSNDDLGFSVGQGAEGDGSLIVRRTTGDYTSTGNSMYGIYLGDGTTTNPGLQLDPTEFHHFAVTVDENGDITAIYANGDYVASQISNGFGITDEETAVVGCRIKNGVADAGFCGYLDDLGIARVVLTEAEIELAMAEGFSALWDPPQPVIPGDTDNNQIVDGADAANMATNWGATVDEGDYSKGDFNGDGVVDMEDASILAANWGDHTSESTGASAVPEPGTFALLLAALLAGVAMRRRV